VYDVPDYFNGTFRVMGGGRGADALGAFEHRALVPRRFRDLAQRADVPGPGRREPRSASRWPTTSVGSGKSGNVKLALAASAGIEPLDGTERQLTIAEIARSERHVQAARARRRRPG